MSSFLQSSSSSENSAKNASNPIVRTGETISDSVRSTFPHRRSIYRSSCEASIERTTDRKHCATKEVSENDVVGEKYIDFFPFCDFTIFRYVILEDSISENPLIRYAVHQATNQDVVLKFCKNLYRVQNNLGIRESLGGVHQVCMFVLFDLVLDVNGFAGRSMISWMKRRISSPVWSIHAAILRLNNGSRSHDRANLKLLVH